MLIQSQTIFPMQGTGVVFGQDIPIVEQTFTTFIPSLQNVKQDLEFQFMIVEFGPVDVEADNFESEVILSKLLDIFPDFK